MKAVLCFFLIAAVAFIALVETKSLSDLSDIVMDGGDGKLVEGSQIVKSKL
jgi:hypothetical protein